MQSHLYELTGIHFDIEEVEQQVEHETLSGSSADTTKAFYSNGTETEFYATGFKFAYKGTVISGSLPRVYAGFASRLDREFKDVMPAVIAACGFPIDADEIGQ